LNLNLYEEGEIDNDFDNDLNSNDGMTYDEKSRIKKEIRAVMEEDCEEEEEEEDFNSN
jgi:hypothetical protein